MRQPKPTENALNGAPVTRYPSSCKLSLPEYPHLCRLPSDVPSVRDVYPPSWMLGGLPKKQHLHWRVNVNRLEDPAGFFDRTLPRLRVYSFRQGRVDLRSVSDRLDHISSAYARRGSERSLRAVLYERGDDPKYGEFRGAYDPRLKKGSFTEEFTQDSGSRFGRPAGGQLDYTSVRCARIDIPDGAVKHNDLYEAATRAAAAKHSPEFHNLLSIYKLIKGPRPKEALEAWWLVFNPPLKSSHPGGPRIISMLTESKPQGFELSQHPDYDPWIDGFSNWRPFQIDAWYHPKTGSRIDGTAVNEFCLGLEKATKGLGDYIFFRIRDIPSCSYKTFFTGKFGWIRDHYHYILAKEGGNVAPYLNRVRSIYVGRTLASFEGGLAKLVGYLNNQQLTHRWVSTLEGVVSELGPLATVASPTVAALGFLVALVVKATSFFVSQNYASAALLVRAGAYVALLLSVLLVRAGAYVALLLWGKASVVISPVLLITHYPRLFAKLLLTALFMASVLISVKGCLVWLLFVGLLYIWVDSVRRKYAGTDLSKSVVPGCLHRYLRAPTDGYFALFVALLPLIINSIFGAPTLLPVGVQRVAAMAMLSYSAGHLWVVLLTYWGFYRRRSPSPALVRLFPKLLRVRSFYLTRVTARSTVRPTALSRYNVFRRYPLVPPYAYSLVDRLRPKPWVALFFLLGVVAALLLVLIFYSLTINLEGALGRALFGQSWVDWFTSYNPKELLPCS